MKIAVVTGASSGMGREFVIQLDKLAEYDEMWVISRRAEKLYELEPLVGCKLRILPLDLTRQESFDAYKNLLEQINPEIKTLINCSGFGKFGTYKDIPLSDSMGMIDLNCKALVMMTELSLPYMAEGSQIVQLDSLSAFQPVPYLNVYAATKAFVLSYSRALGVELKPRKIRVMAVCPGWVRTDFFDRAQTDCTNAVTYFNRMYEPSAVVQTALNDLFTKKKDVSIHGAKERRQVRLVKHLSAKRVMKIWMKQQNHKQ